MPVDEARASAVFEDLWRQLVVGAPDRFWRRLDDDGLAVYQGLGFRVAGSWPFWASADLELRPG